MYFNIVPLKSFKVNIFLIYYFLKVVGLLGLILDIILKLFGTIKIF
jgi:hypothetical protein